MLYDNRPVQRNICVKPVLNETPALVWPFTLIDSNPLSSTCETWNALKFFISGRDFLVWPELMITHELSLTSTGVNSSQISSFFASLSFSDFHMGCELLTTTCIAKHFCRNQ